LVTHHQPLIKGKIVSRMIKIPQNFFTFEKISLDALVTHHQPFIRGQIVSKMIKIHNSWILLDGRRIIS
jgi:hypothetical protein